MTAAQMASLSTTRPPKPASPTAASWLSTDPADYLSGGYWLHVSGDILGENFLVDDAGAFVDGPELSLADRPTMPVQGTATYRGAAEGLYGLEYGADFPQYRGDTAIGAWSGDLRLTANFAARTIGGCVGCDVGTLVDGQPSDYRIRLGDISFDTQGTFRGSTVRLEHPALSFSRNSGSWGGMFSNRVDQTGDPRLVAGTLGGEAHTSGGTTSALVGAWYGTK